MSVGVKIIFNGSPSPNTNLKVNDIYIFNLDFDYEFISALTSEAGKVTISSSTTQQAKNYHAALTRDYGGGDYTFETANNYVIIQTNKVLTKFTVTEDTGVISYEAYNGAPIDLTPTLELSDRTAINEEKKIQFCNSPIHLRVYPENILSTILDTFVYLWIWRGSLKKELGAPNVTLYKAKVSTSDRGINFQIADYIKAYLESGGGVTNNNQPNFAYNEAAPPVVTGQGVFYQVIYQSTTNQGLEKIIGKTQFATLGYRWNYEQTQTGNNGLSGGGSTGFLRSSNRWYNKKIANYFTQSFDLTKTAEAATSANLIITQPVTPPVAWTRSSIDSSLIVYINKLGLWDTFTPHGKITVPTKLKNEQQNKMFRRPSLVDNSYTHSKLNTNTDVSQSYIINSGSLTEDMIDQVEQIIYSPKVYLIMFNGDVNLETTVGITIDSTAVTIDDENITIDSATVTEEYLGLFNGFRQIPVIPTDNGFVRKTRVNDKNEINYDIRLEETNNKILDLR